MISLDEYQKLFETWAMGLDLNQVVNRDVYLTVDDAVYWAVNGDVTGVVDRVGYRAAYWVANRNVYWIVGGSVNGVVDGAVSRAVCDAVYEAFDRGFQDDIP